MCTDCCQPLVCLWQHCGMLGLQGTVAGQLPSDSFPTCPCASPVPAVLPSRTVTILPLAAMSGLHIYMPEPLKKHSIVCCQHDTESHQDQHMAPCPSATHHAQLLASPDFPGFLAQSIFPLTNGSSTWARCDKGPPFHLTKVPRDVTPSGDVPRMETDGTTCGMTARPTAPCKICSRAHVPHQKCGTGLWPPPH